MGKYVSNAGFGYARINYNQGRHLRFSEAFVVQEKSDVYVFTKRLRKTTLPSKTSQSEQETQTAPEPAPSSNILNVLNDDCLQEIFRNLSLFDLCSVANVCKKFKQNAEEIFTLKFSNSMVTLDELHVAEHILRSFGTKIKSLSLNAPHKNALLLMLITYCSGSKCQLERLDISGYEHSDLKLWFKMLPPIFQRLKYLKCYANDKILKICRDLHHLEINGSIYFWSNRTLQSSTLNTFGRLENLSIPLHCSHIINEMKPKSSLKILKLNRLDSKTINRICWKFPNLEEIICETFIDDRSQKKPFVSALARLKKLNKIAWNTYRHNDVNESIGYFSEANVLIEWLVLHSYDPSSNGMKLNIIGILPALKVLEIVGMRQFDLSDLTGCLPQLKELRFVRSSYTGREQLQNTSIIEIVKYAEQMTFLIIDNAVNGFIIDDDFYDKLLMIIKQRKLMDKLTIEFRTSYRNIKMIVSHGKILQNSDLLDIQINRRPLEIISSYSVPPKRKIVKKIRKPIRH